MLGGFSSLFFCFPSSRKESKENEDLEGSLKLTDVKPGCIFCDVDRSHGFDIVLEEGEVVVFRDRNPAAKEHLLAIPINHIDSVKDLTREHLPLVRDLENAGHRALDSGSTYFPPEMRRLGFHIPPANSVDHLHLHIHGLPYKSLYRRLKYPVVKGTHGKAKGFSWFVEISQAKVILERGGKIGILPC